MTTSIKTCFGCKQEKSVDEFYRHPAMADGRLNKCKSCKKADSNQHRRENIEKVREYDRKRGSQPHRVASRREYSRTEQGRERCASAKRAYAERNPLKRAAHVAVGNALRDGRLVKEPCEICTDPKAEAHHDDYSKPLEVRWLCDPHHKQWHKENRALHDD